MTTDQQNNALDKLSEITQEAEAARQRFESKVDGWWDSLSEQEREWAFYSVCKRLYQGEIKERGTYRYVLYDVFGFNAGMYTQGMDCGFMALHNSIMTEDQFNEANKWMCE
jgi:hypothetical protein